LDDYASKLVNEKKADSRKIETRLVIKITAKAKDANEIFVDVSVTIAIIISTSAVKLQ